jgi:hypothetical protein
VKQNLALPAMFKTAFITQRITLAQQVKFRLVTVQLTVPKTPVAIPLKQNKVLRSQYPAKAGYCFILF